MAARNQVTQVNMTSTFNKVGKKVVLPVLLVFLTIHLLKSPQRQGHVRQPAFSTSAVKCNKVPLDKMKSILMSQDEEDKDLLTWFNGLCHGTYIEMGGLDGVELSNSHAFNKGPLGWKGVLIEPSERYNDLIKNRPNEIVTIRGAVCDTETIVHYVNMNAVGGIWEFAPDSFKSLWWEGIKVENLPQIKCSPLQTLLGEHASTSGIKYYDFFSLDVEGAELLVLKSIDFDQIGFGIILVEADEHNQAKNLMIRSLLTRKGYQFLMEKSRSYWFANMHFDDIYGDILNG